jgi:hypothetical protein
VLHRGVSQLVEGFMQVRSFRYNGSVVYESKRVISLLSMQSFDQVMLAINQMITVGKFPTTNTRAAHNINQIHGIPIITCPTYFSTNVFCGPTGRPNSELSLGYPLSRVVLTPVNQIVVPSEKLE